jgi:hypothetical protein
MPRKPNAEYRSSSSKNILTGFDKMQLSHRRTRNEIRRIKFEQAKRAETGKPHHIEGSHRTAR